MWEVQPWCGFLVASPGLVGPSGGSRSFPHPPLWGRLPPLLTCWSGHAFPQRHSVDQENPRLRGRTPLSCQWNVHYLEAFGVAAWQWCRRSWLGFAVFKYWLHGALKTVSEGEDCGLPPTQRSAHSLPWTRVFADQRSIWFVNCSALWLKVSDTRYLPWYGYFTLTALFASFTISFCTFI